MCNDADGYWEMNATLTKIKTCFEDLGMSIEEIAQDEELELGAVKAALMQCSPRYRNEAKEKVDLGFSEQDQLVAKQMIAEIAATAEDDHTRLRAAQYIRNDAKGRLDLGAKNTPQINVLIFNEALARAQKQMRAARGFRDEKSDRPDVIELKPVNG